MDHTTIAVIGGGPWIPALFDCLHARCGDNSPDLTVRLCARREERLTTIADHIRSSMAIRGRDWRFEVTTSPEIAVADADVVVTMLRVGGSAARRHDELFPRRVGIAGDEGLGPGGFANAWRTAPVMRELGMMVSELAPRSLVLNLVAPLGISTRALLDAGASSVSLCELPVVTQATLRAFLGERGDATALGYAGLNHLGWFWPTDDETRQLLSSVDLRQIGVDPAVYSAFDAIPLHYYSKMFARELPPLGPSERVRADELADLGDRLISAYRQRPGDDCDLLAHRAMPWFDHMLVPVLDALIEGSELSTVIGLANEHRPGEVLVDGVDPLAIVEVQAEVGATPTAAPPPPPPPQVVEFLARLAASERLAYTAALERDRPTMAEALRAHPLDLDERSVESLLPFICEQDQVA